MVLIPKGDSLINGKDEAPRSLLTRRAVITAAGYSGLAAAAFAQTPQYGPGPPTNFVPYDPTISPLGAPAIARGTIRLDQVAGVALGTGMTTGARQTQTTAIQAAINAAIANNKFLEAPPGNYEVDTGLTGVPIKISPVDLLTVPGSFTWRGTADTSLVQYNHGGTGTAPIQIGTLTNVTYQDSLIDIHGLSCSHGNSQAGLTTAYGLYIGSIFLCSFDQVYASSVSVPSYIGIYINGSVSGPMFSCQWGTFGVGGAIVDGVHFTTISTGNIYDNFYMGINNATLTGSYLVIDGSGLEFTEQEFRQINFEHGTVTSVPAVNWAHSNGATIRHMHMEGVTLAGSFPGFFAINGHNLSIDQWTLQNCLVPATVTGQPYVYALTTSGLNVSRINNLAMIYNTNSLVAENTLLVYPGTVTGGDAEETMIENFWWKDSSGGTQLPTFLQIDPHMPIASFQLPEKFLRYEYGAGGSRLIGAVYNIVAAYTMYGQCQDAVLVLGATGTYIVTLGDVLGATGTETPYNGQRCTIVRPFYTSGTITVKDGAGGTLTSAVAPSNAVGALNYQFTGSAWVQRTPVTEDEFGPLQQLDKTQPQFANEWNFGRIIDDPDVEYS